MKYRHSIPWRIVPEEGLPLIVSRAQPGYIAQFFDDDDNARQNAEFVIKAVNMHADLLDFFKAMEQIARQPARNKTADLLRKEVAEFKEILSWQSA